MVSDRVWWSAAMVQDGWTSLRYTPELCCLLALQATSVGQAIAGFAVSILSFLTTWAALVPEPGDERSPGDVAVMAFAYFGLSAAVVVASMAGYWLLQHIPFWLHYTSSHSGHGVPLKADHITAA